MEEYKILRLNEWVVFKYTCVLLLEENFMSMWLENICLSSTFLAKKKKKRKSLDLRSCQFTIIQLALDKAIVNRGLLLLGDTYVGLHLLPWQLKWAKQSVPSIVNDCAEKGPNISTKAYYIHNFQLWKTMDEKIIYTIIFVII